MKWKKLSNREWCAEGARGRFFIEKSCGAFWSRYILNNGITVFRMPPKQRVSEAKTMCEDNAYWEETTCEEK